MLHLIYDTETTGLPLDYKAHVHDVDNWPRVVQLAWILLSDEGGLKVLAGRDHIIFPMGYEIPEASTEIHGITNEIAIKEGQPLGIVLSEFAIAQEIADIQVGHNVNFDRKNLGAEFIRQGADHVYEAGKIMPRYCTMFSTTKLCGLRNARNGMKWPTLQELYFHLFNEEFSGEHDAMVDVMATRNCYEQLLKLGHLDPEMIIAETKAKNLDNCQARYGRI